MSAKGEGKRPADVRPLLFLGNPLSNPACEIFRRLLCVFIRIANQIAGIFGHFSREAMQPLMPCDFSSVEAYLNATEQNLCAASKILGAGGRPCIALGLLGFGRMALRFWRMVGDSPLQTSFQHFAKPASQGTPSAGLWFGCLAL